MVVALLFGRLYTRWFAKPVRRWVARRGWKVGVTRIKGDRWGATGRARVVDEARLPGAEVPTARIAEPTDEVRAGRFTR